MSSIPSNIPGSSSYASVVEHGHPRGPLPKSYADAVKETPPQKQPQETEPQQLESDSFKSQQRPSEARDAASDTAKTESSNSPESISKSDSKSDAPASPSAPSNEEIGEPKPKQSSLYDSLLRAFSFLKKPSQKAETPSSQQPDKELLSEDEGEDFVKIQHPSRSASPDSQ
jgi:hypothetical protein